ncbi:hypothetical protein [Actinomyces sp. MRS3W]|uniref:hypothetical protein n=1 Tax=Actinomyces sp. MRS3W TaxID=2800796 RepID=UPI0028FDB8B6|nr:hypothetical protein [Actinomyces sp. MRS3W]MDU0348319.1 hypothetical protein [Actinomyces sp. MRS3W]
MSAERRIAAGACLLCVGVLVGCVQAWLAVSGRAPALSGLSLLALGLGGVGAWLMLTSCDVAVVPELDAELAAVDAEVSAGPNTADADGDGDGEDAGDVLAQAARIVDGAVASEAEAVVDRIHGQPHTHLHMVLSPEDGPGGDDPEMLCELTAPRGAMGWAVGALAQLMHDPHHVRGILEHLASDGDEW